MSCRGVAEELYMCTVRSDRIESKIDVNLHTLLVDLRDATMPFLPLLPMIGYNTMHVLSL